MRFAADTRRRTSPRSTTARKVASSREARQRRREQRRRRFAQQWQRLETTLLGGVQGLPRLGWRRLRLRLPGFSGFHASKLISALLLLAVIGTLYTVQEDESFFVYQENVQFSQTHYLTREELYAYCDIESWSVLWIDPALIREQIMAHPYVADAQVQVRWPAQVNVTVTEVEPVALWSTDQGNYWLLQGGRALVVRSEQPVPPIHIVDPEFAARAPGTDADLHIQPQLLEAALALANQLPGMSTVRYNRSQGLNFAIPDTNTWVYWGDGRRFDEKWRALQSAMPEIQMNHAASQIFSVIAPNRPFFRHYAEATTVE